MSCVRFNNLRFKDIESRIDKIIGSENNVSGVVRCVYAKNNDEWSILAGFIDIGGDKRYRDFDREEYPEYLFIEQTINELSAIDIFRGVEVDGRIPVSEAPLIGVEGNGFNWTEVLIPSHVLKKEFPVRRFSAEVKRNVYGQDLKLIGYEKPFHHSAYSFISDFLGVEGIGSGIDGVKGRIIVDFIDRRAGLDLSDEYVTYQSTQSESVCLVGEIDGERVELISQGGRHSCNMNSVSDVELWLVNGENEVLDYCSTSEWEFRFDSKNDSELKKSLVNIISKGEGERCEFKPFIDLSGKMNKKKHEIEKTVCALSNHEGGKLFFGVADDTEVIGVGEECGKEYRCNPRDAVEMYGRDVSKCLQESLIDAQCFDFVVVELGDYIVLVFTVYKSGGLNYLTHKNEVYIRRGASIAKMTPSEIQGFSSRKGLPSELADFRW